MAQQTAMQEAIEYLKLFNLEASAIILEDRFLEIEKENLKNAVIYGLDEDGHTGDWKISVAENYYKKTYTEM